MTKFNEQTDPAVLHEKIQWYSEILELEPGSKVFFPYAKLLVQLNKIQEATTVLLAGLERHPEFTEARLFLISLLHAEGEQGLCAQQVSRLAVLFGAYPSFWDAWSTYSNLSGQKSDLALSISFLGAMLRDRDLTILDVMITGLQHIRNEQISEPVAKPAPSPQLPTTKRPENGDLRVSVSESPYPIRQVRQENEEGSQSTEEKSSLRTRSMADVLADQGDVRGAMDIYGELLKNADNEQEKAELTEAMEGLKPKIGQESQVNSMFVASASSKPRNAAALPQSSVIDLLEKLAVRLETKADQ